MPTRDQHEYPGREPISITTVLRSLESWTPTTTKNKPSAFYDSEPSGPSNEKDESITQWYFSIEKLAGPLMMVRLNFIRLLVLSMPYIFFLTCKLRDSKILRDLFSLFRKFHSWLRYFSFRYFWLKSPTGTCTYCTCRTTSWHHTAGLQTYFKWFCTWFSCLQADSNVYSAFGFFLAGLLNCLQVWELFLVTCISRKRLFSEMRSIWIISLTFIFKGKTCIDSSSTLGHVFLENVCASQWIPSSPKHKCECYEPTFI